MHVLACASVSIFMNQGLYLRNFIFEFMREREREREREGLGFDSKTICKAADAVIAGFLLLFIAVGCRLGLSFVIVERNMACLYQ